MTLRKIRQKLGRQVRAHDEPSNSLLNSRPRRFIISPFAPPRGIPKEWVFLILDRKLGNQQNGYMKTTLDLPDALVKQVKLRAVREGRKLKDAVADLLRKGLAAAADTEPDAQAPVITKDKKTGLPLIVCKHAASPEEEMTPSAWPISSWPRKWIGTMPLADSNIWLALALSKHEFHAAARAWLAGEASRRSPFCRATQQSFLRLLDHQRGVGPLWHSTS